MTVQEMKREIKKNDVWKIAAIIMTIAFLAVTMILAKEKSYWQGYNDAYNTGRADGWQGCIEENNLYERYERNEQ